jgi:hypothetical protein
MHHVTVVCRSWVKQGFLFGNAFRVAPFLLGGVDTLGGISHLPGHQYAGEPKPRLGTPPPGTRRLRFPEPPRRSSV